MDNHQKKKLLYRYFSGRATPLEETGIETWLSDPDHQEYFFEILEDWERTHPQFQPDQEQALQRLQHSVKQTKTKNNRNKKNEKTDKSFHWLWKTVAGLAFLLIAGFLLKDTLLYKTYRSDYGMTQNIHLPDGTEVNLNANSTLRASRWIKWLPIREVWITGEAYFSVKKTKDKRAFVVHTPQLNVEVLGTKFNIRDRNESAKVVLQEGKVKVICTAENKGSALLEKTGDIAEITAGSSKMITRQADPTLHTVWKDKQLKFEEAPLSIVLESIREYYGVKIISPDSALLERRFSGTLPNDNLEIILRSLNNIYASEFTPEIEETMAVKTETSE